MDIALYFDEGPGVGLGHRRRMEALAVELESRAHECALVSLRSRGVIGGEVAVVDSYRVRADERASVQARVVVAVDDLARDLAVDLVVDPSPGSIGATHRRARRVLAGSAYALMPAPDADVVEVAVGGPVRRVLVTTGAADADGVGAGIATALGAVFPEMEIRLAVGLWGATEVPPRIVPVFAPDGLTRELAAASLVVTGGGVTLLESCLLGRPTVALALAQNQCQAVLGLEREHALVVATPETVPETVNALSKDRSRRIALGVAARSAIDGKGATRVADTLEQLMSG